MGHKTQIAVSMAACALWLTLADAAFDRRWPQNSTADWVTYLGGFVVIGAGWMIVESVIRSRQRR